METNFNNSVLNVTKHIMVKEKSRGKTLMDNSQKKKQLLDQSN